MTKPRSATRSASSGASDTTASKSSRRKRPLVQTTTELYGETAVWACRNLQSGLMHHVHGVLAQLLKQYPEAYALEFLGLEEQ